jgi:uncharacterized protein YndB with AHSA1/START domain
MGTADYSVWIEATPEQVWRVYVGPSRIPEWQTGSPTIEEVRGSGDQPGSSYVSRRRPGAAHTTVTEVDTPRRLMTATEAYFGFAIRRHVVTQVTVRRHPAEASCRNALAPSGFIASTR